MSDVPHIPDPDVPEPDVPDPDEVTSHEDDGESETDEDA